MNREQLMAYWQALQPRERLALALGGAVVLVMVLYFLLWQPLASARLQMLHEVQQQRALLHWMQEAAGEARRLRGAGGENGREKGRRGQSLLSLVDQSAKAHRLGQAVKRVEPDGEEVQIWLEGASFDLFVTWLQMLSRDKGVHVTSVTIERSDEPGRVDVRLRLAEGAS